MNTNHHNDQTSHQRRWRTLAPPLLLLVLATIVVGRQLFSDDGDSQAPRAHAHDTRTPTARFEPAAVTLPARWRITDRSDGVTTWRDPQSDDAVSVAAVESAAAPLASIVAEVARQARTAGPQTQVEAPRQLPSASGSRRDVVLALELRTNVEGRELHVRQIWRRDARAGRDVVATWTSSDDAWSVDPSTTVPTLDLR